ncbi:MAG: type II toxin-antitoxin system PemK/MazF family toxin [Planctomycetes bacterium]|nr:type II toxin-antitoxin system PemK/MazF family toxin [Planctomycetota bacterium]
MSVKAVRRGDVIVVDFSITYPQAGKRPALVVQNDHDNARMHNTIVAQITTNISRAHEATQLLIDRKHVDWVNSGLRAASVVNASALVTVPKDDFVRKIGALSAQTMKDIDHCPPGGGPARERSALRSPTRTLSPVSATLYSPYLAFA